MPVLASLGLHVVGVVMEAIAGMLPPAELLAGNRPFPFGQAEFAVADCASA